MVTGTNNYVVLKTEELQIRKYSPFLESSFLSANGATACHEWRAVPDIWRSSADKYADRVAVVDPYHNPPSKFTYRQVRTFLCFFILSSYCLYIFHKCLKNLPFFFFKNWVISNANNL